MADGEKGSFFRRLLGALLGGSHSSRPTDLKPIDPDSSTGKHREYYRKQKEEAAERNRRRALVERMESEFRGSRFYNALSTTQDWYDGREALQRCRDEINRTGEFLSFQAVVEQLLAERAAAAALESERRTAEQRGQRLREERRVAKQREQDRQEEEKQRRAAEVEQVEKLKREIHAEETLRQGLLEKERKKAALRTEMQKSGEIVADETVRSEKEELARLREVRKPRKPQE